MSPDEITKQQDERVILPAIQRAPYRTLTIYEVSEDELKILEKGSPESIYLNFSIAMLPVAFTLMVTLLTTEIPSAGLRSLFQMIMVVFYVAGLFLFVLWYRTRSSVSDCVATIRERLHPPEEGVPAIDPSAND